ncbi:MAG: hypothetical protein JO352_27165 [Chloroflexi bacterium]|nr:hypothetical protein [Chloroflexota bacterium]
MLAIIQNEQYVAFADGTLERRHQRLGRPFAYCEGSGHRVDDQCLVAYVRQVHEPDAAAVDTHALLGGAQRQTCLADASWASQSDEPKLSELPSDFGNLVRAPYEARELDRQVSRGRALGVLHSAFESKAYLPGASSLLADTCVPEAIIEGAGACNPLTPTGVPVEDMSEPGLYFTTEVRNTAIPAVRCPVRANS